MVDGSSNNNNPLVTTYSTETQIALLRRDLDRLGPLYDKLLEALARVTEVSANIKQLVAVQEEKILYGNKNVIDLKKDIVEITSRVNKLENWKWWVIGVVAVIGIIVGGTGGEVIRMIHF